MSSLTPIQAEKDRLRRDTRHARHALHPEWREAASRQIAKRLLSWPTLISAQVVHCYMAWRSEVATSGLIEQLLKAEKKVVAPRVELSENKLQHYYIHKLDDVTNGHFGILEPDPLRCEAAAALELQLIIIPGVAFDRHGNRLGSGHGYYDRFLAQSPALRVGLAFAMQIIEAVPAGSYDQKMDFVVTEEEIIACAAQ